MLELFLKKEAGSTEELSQKEVSQQEVSQSENLKAVKYIENPLPLPKKHQKRVLDYPVRPAGTKKDDDDYDYPVSDEDDYDI